MVGKESLRFPVWDAQWLARWHNWGNKEENTICERTDTWEMYHLCWVRRIRKWERNGRWKHGLRGMIQAPARNLWSASHWKATQTSSSQKGEFITIYLYWRFIESFGSWRTRLVKWIRMMVTPEGLKARSTRIIFSWDSMVQIPLPDTFPIVEGTTVTAGHCHCCQCWEVHSNHLSDLFLILKIRFKARQEHLVCWDSDTWPHLTACRDIADLFLMVIRRG